MTTFKARERDTVIQALRAGVVPRTGQHLIQVGRAREIETLLRDIERIAEGGTGFRLEGKDDVIIAAATAAGKTEAAFLPILTNIANAGEESALAIYVSPLKAHHGSLARAIREETEKALKQGDRPATAICTTTLELGIDIGAVQSVAQIGPGPSVASLRQRLGRSGRRPGEPAILRSYNNEQALTAKSPLSDCLREALVQSIAMIRLLLRGWFEPPNSSGLHLSTLVQQVLSVIAERSGAHASQLHKQLVSEGAFHGLSQAEFGEFLSSLGSKDLIFQAPTGLLLFGGERGSVYRNFQV